MKNPERVLIGYDEINKVIGVKPVGDDYEHNRSYPFKNRELKGYVRIGNREFLKYIAIKAGIDISKAKKYIAEWNEEQGLLIIDLKQSTNETEEIK